MKRFTKTLLAAAIFSLSASSAIVTEAGCHGRSGGGYHSGGSSYYSHNAYYHRPVYVQPSQPVVYPEPVIQPAPQPQYISQTGTLPAPSSAIPANGFPVGPTTVAQPQQFPQPLMTQPQQQVLQQKVTPQQTITQPQPQNQPPVAAGNSAELSALQALGAFAPPQAEGQPTPQTASSATPVSQSLVGTWSARLTNGATVLLNLQADGTFNWTATNASGSTTAFQGRYVADNGSLVLSRSSDNQQLTGSAAMNGNQTFTFKMSNSNAASLEFHRS